MTLYSISIHKYVGSGPTIVANEGGAEIPAVIFSQMDRDLPFDTVAISKNFVSLANGLTPMEKVDSKGRSVYFQSLPGAVTIRFQDAQGGVSRDGLVITLNRAAPDHIIADLENKIDADFMKALCGAIVAPMPATPVPSTQQTLSC